MPTRVEFTNKLAGRCREIARAVKPGSRARDGAGADFAAAVREDHAGMIARGVDRDGRPLAPLAPSTLKRRQGDGPPLSPRGPASRFATNAEVTRRDERGALVVAKGFRGITSRRGVSIVPFHLNGTARMPKRDVGGVTPRGLAALRARFARFVADLGRLGGP